MKKSYKGFTLVELLTTLMIIGVIAATITPVLYSIVKQDILRTQFMRTYALLHTGLKLASLSYDGKTPQCYQFTYGGIYKKDNPENINDISEEKFPELYKSQTKDCGTFYYKLLESFKIRLTCPKNAYPDCIPQYGGYDYVWKDKIRKDPKFQKGMRDACFNCTEEQLQQVINDKLNSLAKIYGIDEHPLSTENIKTQRTAHILQSGEIILEFGTNGSNLRYFAVDINGKKLPNRWGYDLFPFVITGNPSIPLAIGDAGEGYIEYGGYTTTEMIRKTFYRQKMLK